MLKPPRTAPVECLTGCGCPVCADPLTAWTTALQDTDGDVPLDPEPRLDPWPWRQRRD